MRQDRNYWSRHVAAWRRSGLSKKAYSEQHELAYWSMRYWSDKLADPRIRRALRRSSARGR
ncbi:MAG: hypothetical protein OXI80_09115 [Caldilineaceae bacterium]|nr:hypothetical protein [Caldilineaceae bacterium]